MKAKQFSEGICLPCSQIDGVSPEHCYEDDDCDVLGAGHRLGHPSHVQWWPHCAGVIQHDAAEVVHDDVGVIHKDGRVIHCILHS